jgi:thiol-disulfide isomerase/thioredoxin
LSNPLSLFIIYDWRKRMRWKEKSRSNNQHVLFWMVIIFSAILLAGYFFFSGKEETVKKSALNSAADREQSAAWDVESINSDESLSSSSLQGKIVILHFWASWCPPCRKEFPEFIRWAEKNLSNEDIAIVPVSLDKSKEEGKAFFENYSTNISCYFDPGTASEKFGIQGIPSTVVIDRRGKIAFSREGIVEWKEAVIGKVVKDLVKEGR